MTSIPDLPRPEYPRPQWRRDRWRNLNGRWWFAVDDDDSGRAARWHEVEAGGLGADDGPFSGQVVVPFAPHTEASGVADPTLHRVLWYARCFDAHGLAEPGERLLLHIGAADHDATVWVNGQHVASHRGGYTPISADVTDAVRDGENVVVVRVEDDHEDLGQPRGKQYWLQPSEYVFYRGTTGIWQTVWLEPVAAASVLEAHVVPVLHDASVDVTVRVTRPAVGSTLRVTIARDGGTVVRDTLLLTDADVRRRWRLTEHLSARDAKLLEFQGVATWHPGNPRLYDLTLEVLDDAGRVLDRVSSYFGMRSVSTHDGHVLLNGRPIFQRLVLDQGFFPQSGYTAPSDDAIRADIELAQQLGFNGARKHQKIEDPRYLYWADRLGFLVWEEMPSAFRFSSGYLAQTSSRMAGSGAPRPEPSVHRRVGADERELGGALGGLRVGRASARSSAGDVPPHQGPGLDPARGVQRRVGARDDRPLHHPRLLRPRHGACALRRPGQGRGLTAAAPPDLCRRPRPPR